MWPNSERAEGVDHDLFVFSHNLGEPGFAEDLIQF
jgi:hypothetical protein